MPRRTSETTATPTRVHHRNRHGRASTPTTVPTTTTADRPAHRGHFFVPRQTLTHDHAWRRIRDRGEEPGLLEGRYRCDLCSAEWAL